MNSFGQKQKLSSNYENKIYAYQKNYTKNHEVVVGSNKKYFRFYKPNYTFLCKANFSKIEDTTTVIIKTSGIKIPQKYFIRYGTIKFTFKNKSYSLTVYQSKDLIKDSLYKNYLFLPFSDKTNGANTYGTGRYLDLTIEDVLGNGLFIDFNKAYNPYCVYSNDYNCPIPPKENRLPIAITAGEMNFAKPTTH